MNQGAFGPRFQEQNMTRGRTESQDLMSAELDGVLDFMTIRTGQPQIEPEKAREWKDLAEAESFMNEPLVIQIHTTNDKNAPPSVYVGLNGEGGWLPRGLKIRLKRKFVERLAQSQSASFQTKSNPDPHADEGTNVLRSSGQEYPFEVLQDPNPKGRAWLARVTRQGC